MRAVGPATQVLADRSPLVREAAAGTLGHLEAKSAVADLLRLLKNDRVASVRRTAAWAVTTIGAEDAAQDLASALAKDSDASVREMCAWGLGNLEHDHQCSVVGCKAR
jgi:epoxyqueuosine reductase